MSEGSKFRISLIGVVVLGLFCALFVRLWFLQVGSGQEFASVAETNRTEVIQTESPRGRILDRNGTPLVTNREASAIVMDPAISDEDRELSIGRLSELLRVDRESIEERFGDERNSPLQPIIVAIDVPPGTVSKDALLYIREHQEDFPGVEAVQQPIREYPEGVLAAHVLGYVGEINEEELDLRADSDADYQIGEDIGKAGVELTFEPELRGVPRRETLEVDADRNVVGTLDLREGEPGKDVKLTIDAEIQRAAEAALSQGLDAAATRQDENEVLTFETFNADAGSIVVLDARDGSVVAMASYPSYDPSEFVGGIDPKLFAFYNEEQSAFPLSNRAIQGQYALGSTFKLISGLAALESGLRTPETTIVDGGVYVIGDREFTNAGGPENSYGPVNLSGALTVSSDVYFYGVGGELWSREEPESEAIQTVARNYGFEAPSGIPLPDEQTGRVPDSEWKRGFAEASGVGSCDEPAGQEEADRCTWFPGDNVNLAVGQGDFLATPLQLANAYATFMNGGTLFQPKLVSEILEPDGSVARTTEDTVIRTNEVMPAWRNAIIDGLIGVVNSGEGTVGGPGIFDGFPDKANTAGKTGTAEVGGKQDTSLYVGIWPARAPVGQPQYIVAAVIEEAGFGSEVAAPIVRSVMDALAGVVSDDETPSIGDQPGAIE